MAKCEACKGKGEVAGTWVKSAKCLKCNGTGCEPQRFGSWMDSFKLAIKSRVVDANTPQFRLVLTTTQAFEHMRAGGLVYTESGGTRFYYKVEDGGLWCRVNECGGWNHATRSINPMDVLYAAKNEVEPEHSVLSAKVDIQEPFTAKVDWPAAFRTFNKAQAIEELNKGAVVWRVTEYGLKIYYKIDQGKLMFKNDTIWWRAFGGLSERWVFCVAEEFAFKCVPADIEATIGRAMRDHKEPCKFKINTDGMEEAWAYVRRIMQDLDTPVYLTCSDCHGKGKGWDGVSCVRCNGTGRVKVESKEKKMLTHDEYELGMNRLAQPWCMMTTDAKKVLTSASFRPNSVEYMHTTGAWQLKHESCFTFNDGMIYRIHPSTPIQRKGKVAAKDLKGLVLEYDSRGQAWLFIGPDTGSSCIPVAALANLCDSTGNSVLAKSFRQVEEMNRSL